MVLIEGVFDGCSGALGAKEDLTTVFLFISLGVLLLGLKFWVRPLVKEFVFFLKIGRFLTAYSVGEKKFNLADLNMLLLGLIDASCELDDFESLLL